MAWFLVLLVFVAVPLALFLTGVLISAPGHQGPKSDHFDGSKFKNPGNVRAKGGVEVFKWMMSRERGRWKEITDEHHGKRPLSHFRDGIRVTFVNHSTFLVQVDGLNILFDPVWSKRASPFQWVGPKRMKPPGIRFEDLPRIHHVILTHNHYDHLDMLTMRMLFGAHHPKIIVPLGIRAFLDKQYISGATELDWWAETALSETVTIQSVPAQHFSGRGLLDRDATLWCGYVMGTSAGNIYFAGDTGYNDVTFKEIGSRCGPIKISLLPIGAYKPAWFMSPIHVSPEESVRIHLDVQSTVSIAMHFGTFPLADDGQDDPAADLRAALEKYNLPEESFIILQEGEARVFD
jgi:L-ascorbate metabolism protein UlaG (beta-lactamase superfamily)